MPSARDANRLTVRCCVSFCELGSPLLAFVHFLVSFALQQEHHHGLAMALTRVVDDLRAPFVNRHPGACGFDRSLTERAGCWLLDGSNPTEHHRRFAVLAISQHGPVVAEPMVSTEVIHHGRLASELGSSKQHGAASVNQLELPVGWRQHPSSTHRFQPRLLL